MDAKASSCRWPEFPRRLRSRSSGVSFATSAAMARPSLAYTPKTPPIFGAALNVNVHVHGFVLDGVSVEEETPDWRGRVPPMQELYSS